MRRLIVQTVRLFIGLVLLGVLAAAGAYLYLLRSLPTTAGTFEVSGLSGPVEIVRGADAVPHIIAGTKLDALFGLGFVHAQDRLWQMEFQRRVGHGRLSEILGSATVRQDRFLRTVGFGRAAQAAWDRLPGEARTQVDAYVAGVNAFLESHTGSRLPPEFSLLGIKPEPWSGPDVLVWVKMMAWDLSANYSTELLRHDIAARVGMERMKELLPPYPASGLNILSGPAEFGATITSRVPPAFPSRNTDEPWTTAFARSLSERDPPVRDFLTAGGGATEGIGSNNWVVDGTMTASGKPLLANDPHLGAQIPSLWYLAHMTAGDFDVIGATLPGTPAVAIGRNQHIAWGETNMFADVQDLYREHVDSAGTKAEFRGGWEPLRQIQETVHVKGGADITVNVRMSRHGPLVSDAINANNMSPTGSRAVPEIEPLAFRWTALDDDDPTIVAFFHLAEARNWTDFTAAMRDFSTPSQNFVYADVDGHIGYYAPGRIPIRGGGDGLVPSEGWTGNMEWTGWVPFDELPHTYDPPSHFVVTANNRPVPPGYKYALGFEYHEPYRAQRITDLLSGRRQLTPNDFAAIQSDTFSSHAKTLLPLLLQHVHPDTPQDVDAVNVLRGWNLNATGASAGAAIFEAWFLQLAPEIVGNELDATVERTYERRFSFVTRFVTNTLQGSSTFCSGDTCDKAVTAALHQGVATLTGRLGPNVSRWRWADAHAAVFAHQALDTVPVIGWFVRRTVPNRGDWSTVNVGAVDVDHPFDQHDIPGYRQIIDLSPANDSRFLASVGQSGHVLSPHYDDGLQNWHDVRHQPMQMDWARIQHQSADHLRLVPRPRP